MKTLFATLFCLVLGANSNAFADEQIKQYFGTTKTPNMSKAQAAAALVELCEDSARMRQLILVGLEKVNLDLLNGTVVDAICIFEKSVK
ncbi:MAG: hypothetical protein AABY64_10300 [Bdellovibrionota bacterium]